MGNYKDALLKSLMKDFETSVGSYDSELKKQCDRLAGYAHVAVQALVDAGQEDFVFLKHDGMREWWQARLEAVHKHEQALLNKQRKAELRAQALSKLTQEERIALGLRK